MCISISKAVVDDNQDFSMWDSLSFSDPSLPFGNILSADRVREWFANNDALFGSGENNVWNTGLTLWSFIGQILGDGKQRSCNAAVTHATRYCLDRGLEPPGAHSGDYCRARQKLNAAVVRQLACDAALIAVCLLGYVDFRLSLAVKNHPHRSPCPPVNID